MTQGKKMKWFASVPVGTAHIVSQWKKSKHIDIKRLRESVLDNYKRVFSSLRKQPFHVCYGTCGLLRLIALALKKDEMKGDKNFTQPIVVTEKDVDDALTLSRTHKIYIDDPAKGKIVYAGSFIVSVFMKKLKLKKIVVSSMSSREGYLIKLIRQGVIM